MGTPIAVCDHVASSADPSAEADANPITVEGLCTDGRALREFDNHAGDTRLVLGLCGRAPGPSELQSRIRSAGLDPFLVEAVDLRGFEDREQDALDLLRSRAAGLGARGSPGPDQVRMRLARDGVSRRSLLRLGGITYEPVAAVSGSRCRGSERCGVCVGACPVDAISASGAFPTIGKDACVACGACVTACPARAIDMPGGSLAGSEEEVRQLAPGRGIAFVCRSVGAYRPEDTTGPGWMPVDVPCLSAVSPGWMLGALASGATGVALVGCGTWCRADGASATGERVGFAREVLARMGEDGTARIRFGTPESGSILRTPPPSEGLMGGGGDLVPVLNEPAATATAVAELVAPRSRDQNHTPIPGGPLGRVHVDESGCTLCGSCVLVCPTDALRSEAGAVTSSLSFSPSRCVGCGHCATACPEDVLTVEQEFSLGDLEERRLRTDVVVRCRRCGAPIGPAGMVDKVRALLPDASPAMLAAMTELCSNCRGLPDDNGGSDE